MANTAKTPQENRKSQKHRKKTASSYNVNDNANKKGKENGDGDIAPPFRRFACFTYAAAYAAATTTKRYGMVIDYKKEINEYGASLPPLQKDIAREVFTELLETGFDYRWLYYAIQNLGQRDIVQYRSLFFYKPFQEEVQQMVEEGITKEEEHKQWQERICDAILEQIEQAKKQKPVVVNIKRQSRKKIDFAAELAKIEEMEE